MEEHTLLARVRNVPIGEKIHGMTPPAPSGRHDPSGGPELRECAIANSAPQDLQNFPGSFGGFTEQPHFPGRQEA